MKLSNRQKRDIKTMLDQARRALSIQRYTICEQLCRKVETLYAKHPDALNLRGICAIQTARLEEALPLLEQAVAAAPERSDLHINLGGLHLAQSRPEAAIKSYRQALRLDPRSLAAQLGIGSALLDLGQDEEAIEALDKLQGRMPDDVGLHMKLYTAHYRSEQPDEAREHLHRILAIAPDHADAHFQMGRLALEQGDKQQAEAEIRAGLRIRPDDAIAYGVLAGLKRFTAKEDPDIAAMADLYAQRAADTDARIALSFPLGKAMEDLEHYDEAFAYFAEGNALCFTRHPYDIDAAQSQMQKIITAFTPARLSETGDLDDATPVFILGMPRCGSTLTEQILAAHPDVSSRGECDLFEAKALPTRLDGDHAPSPDRWAAYTPAQWAEIGRAYVHHLRRGNTTARRITDKTLTNFRLAGLIHCALPQAKIVHVRRHPLDTCLSIYSKNLQGSQFGFGHDLTTMGRYYRMYLDMMQHWRDSLPAGSMYELDYEHLVANQEVQTRSLLEFCGLPWDDRCLRFNEAKTVVRTASISQVRRPIYSDSMAAWKRYERQLQPLIDVLGPAYSTAYRPGAPDTA